MCSPPARVSFIVSRLPSNWEFEEVYTYTVEKAMAPHSSTLACKIPWVEEPGRLQSMGLRRVGHDWATWLSLFTFMHWRRKWQRTPVFLPGESQGMGEPGGLPSLRLHRVGHDWSDLLSSSSSSKLEIIVHKDEIMVEIRCEENVGSISTRWCVCGRVYIKVLREAMPYMPEGRE